ncbi:response regulator [Agrobacterium cavarae]|uniref:response regulator n=1 Tax=Agrobacterium cavarae TaxID=2528239 RepID=UPI003EE619AD
MGQSRPINTHAILLVEDEAIVRFGLASFFEDYGYRVLEASDADEAIRILERESSIRIVFTDVHLPGAMDGLKLAHYVRERYPPTLLLLTSSSNPVDAKSLPSNSHFITKPFDPPRILQVIERLTN